MVNRVDEFWSDLQARSAPTTSSKSAAAVLRVLNEETITTACTKRQTRVAVASGAVEAHSVGHGEPTHCHSPARASTNAKADLKTRCRPLVQRLVDVSLSVRLSALTDLQVRQVNLLGLGANQDNHLAHQAN